MTVLNTIVAQQLKDFKVEVDGLINKKKLKKDEAIFNVLREYIKSSKRIRFDGDGYSDLWVQEAVKRKLSHNKNTPAALEVLIREESLDLFRRMEVLTPTEARARMEVELETYILQTQIEGRVLSELFYNSVLPAAVAYQNVLLENIMGLKDIYGAAHKTVAGAQLGILEDIAKDLQEARRKTDAMNAARKKANNLTDLNKRARSYCESVLPYFEEIRYHSDRLERRIGQQYWSLPKYRELLFTK
jgi:glutamine synthetase